MTSEILQQLHFCSNKRFTGKLSVISLDGNSIDNLQGYCWNLYFYRGRLVGDSGGVHPVRRMRRQFSRQCIELPEELEVKLLSSAETKNRNYFIVGELLANQHIDRDQAEQIIVGSLVEVLFDIFQYEAIGKLADKSRLSCILENDKTDGAMVPAILLKSELLWEEALSDLRTWQEKGLMKYSPNLCPEIHDFVNFQAMTSAKTYNKIVNLLDPDRTLRDIATKIDEDLSIVTFGLAKYQAKKVLSFRRVGDISSVGKRLSTGIINSTSSSVFKDKTSPADSPTKRLIIHMGENDAEMRTIETIVQKAGYDYANLREPGQAMIALLRCNPELIIIDSTANFNANDFCSQLRRTSKFRDTPIVLLQNSDNMVSWMRSKMLNYSESITKPISHQKIFTLIDKYMNRLVSSS
jgi:two-component system, chemotaxis family, response regulator PixG